MKPRFSALLLLGAALPAAAGADTLPLVIDMSHSQVAAEVTGTLDTFTATIQNFTANILLTDNLAGVSAATFHFEFASIKTGNSFRDSEMYKWEQVGTYPDGGFILTNFKRVTDGHYAAKGRLTFHGVVREVAFPVDVKVDDTTLTIDGQTALDTRDYGLPIYRKFLFLSIDPVLQVHFHLVGSVVVP